MTNPANDDAESVSDRDQRTVTLSGRDIHAVAQVLNLLVGGQADRSGELTRIVDKNAGTVPNHDRQLLTERAGRTFANRALRAKYFNRGMFGEAAWDMLLALYVSHQSGARHTVSGLLSLSGVPPTTALRWLDFLEQEQFVTRRANPMDGRVYFVELTEVALSQLDVYFSEVLRTNG